MLRKSITIFVLDKNKNELDEIVDSVYFDDIPDRCKEYNHVEVINNISGKVIFQK